jgi:hypothetical protein
LVEILKKTDELRWWSNKAWRFLGSSLMSIFTKPCFKNHCALCHSKFFSTLNTQLDTAQKILELIAPFVKQDKILPRTHTQSSPSNLLQTLLVNLFQTLLVNLFQTLLVNQFQTLLVNLFQTLLVNLLQTLLVNLLQTLLVNLFIIHAPVSITNSTV